MFAITFLKPPSGDIVVFLLFDLDEVRSTCETMKELDIEFSWGIVSGLEGLVTSETAGFG